MLHLRYFDDGEALTGETVVGVCCAVPSFALESVEQIASVTELGDDCYHLSVTLIPGLSVEYSFDSPPCWVLVVLFASSLCPYSPKVICPFGSAFDNTVWVLMVQGFHESGNFRLPLWTVCPVPVV